MKEFGITTVLKSSYFIRGKLNVVIPLLILTVHYIHLLFHSTVIARSLLLVDEVMKAGMSSLKG